MLSTIKELQDILYQRWTLGKHPEADEDSTGSTAQGDFSDKDEFTGEVISAETGDHICWCEPSSPGQAMAEMVIAAGALYQQFRGESGTDDYIVPEPEADAFLRAFEEFVNKNAGW